MPRASLYLRLSAASTDDSTGLASQEQDLRALAARIGADVVAVHVDDGLSGALRDRPGFLAWLDDARTGRADLLLAHSLDRVTRGGSTALAGLLDLLDEGNPQPRFVTVRDGLDSASPAWRLQAVVLSEVARSEREAIRARILRYREANRAAGRAVGGRHPWPFTTTPKEGGGLRLVPVPERADAIRWALVALRAGGTLHGIAREWTRRGLRPGGGGKDWHVSGVRRILSSPTLYGATIHRGALLRNADGTARLDPEQAILSQATWTELQSLLAARSTEHATYEKHPRTLLAGVLTCATCGRRMHPHHASGRALRYRCAGAPVCPRPASILAIDVEGYLTDVFMHVWGDRPAPPVRPPRPVVDPETLARTEEGLAAADAVLADDDASDEDVLAARRARRELRARLAELRDAAAAPAPEPEPGPRTYAEAWEQADTVGRSRLLAAALDHVVVLPGTRGGTPPPVSERVKITAPPSDYV